VLAVPVCSTGSAAELRAEVDELVCLETPRWFFGVGQFYADFRQTSDEEVVDLLQRAAREEPIAASAAGARVAGADPPLRDGEVEIPVAAARLEGRLTVADGAGGVVVFAHGSGSSRHSPRNRYVAGVLQQAGLATLLFDLLTPHEELHRANVFDIALLAGRLGEVTAWVRGQPECTGLPVGYFGASTGAAAALWAAAEPHADIAAVVSRGGRPDLAGPRLGAVRAPTLLVVGGHDTAVLDLNRRAQAAMGCESRIVVIPGATHLFEEPGTLEQAATYACSWFTDHFEVLARVAGRPARSR
jgi:putative phosphoribosyl transferase